MNTETVVTVSVVFRDSSTRMQVEAMLDKHAEFELVSINGNGKCALDQIVESNPDVVVIDFDLQDMNGLELIKLAKLHNTDSEFLIYTRYEDKDHLFSALKVGATGYLIDRGINESKLVSAIIELYSGGAPMSSLIARKVMSYFHECLPEDQCIEGLTCRETEILKELSFGRNAKRIARQLNISYQTVRTHQKNIYRKVQVSSVTEAINAYRSFAVMQ